MRLFIISLLFAVFGSQTMAQQAAAENGQTFGPWRVTCEALGVDRTACVLAQRIYRAEDQAFIADVLAFQSADTGKTYLSARLPIGVYFPAGFAIKADGTDDVVQFVWQSCSSELCEAVAEVTAESLTAMATPGTIVLGAYRPNVQSENLVFRFSMEQAQAGLSALLAGTE